MRAHTREVTSSGYRELVIKEQDTQHSLQLPETHKPNPGVWDLQPAPLLCPLVDMLQSSLKNPPPPTVLPCAARAQAGKVLGSTSPPCRFEPTNINAVCLAEVEGWQRAIRIGGSQTSNYSIRMHPEWSFVFKTKTKKSSRTFGST